MRRIAGLPFAIALSLCCLLPPTPARAQIAIGIGISVDQQAKIFQPFTQADQSITRQFGGTGLGLALTHNLCEAMQGRLSISSEVGFGSQFCADLPLPAHLPATRYAPLTGEVIAIAR